MYKFTRSEYVHSIISEKYLWFSHVDELNDPFECDLRSFVYNGLFYQQDKTEYLSQRAENSLFGRRNTGSRNHFYDHPLESRQSDNAYDEVRKKEILYNKYYEQRSQIYILSLALTNLSPVMWAHYGDDFKGVCLKLDPILLERALSKKGWRWRRIEIQYTPGKLGLSDDLLEDIVTLVSVKHSDWSYEQEIRYIILIDDADSSNRSGFKVPIDDALQEIHVSDQIDESCVEKYRAVAPRLTIRRITGKKRYGWLEEVDYRDS